MKIEDFIIGNEYLIKSDYGIDKYKATSITKTCIVFDDAEYIDNVRLKDLEVLEDLGKEEVKENKQKSWFF